MEEQKNFYVIPLAIIVAGLIIAGAIISLNNKKTSENLPSSVSSNPTSESESASDKKPRFEITEKDHTKGDSEAVVTIVEFSDFQCPFCQKFHSTLKRTLADYPGRVRWVYKHFPLDRIHSQARPAAEASECAAEQGKFWEFADGLFENQSRLGQELYKELAQNLAFDMVQFNNCFSSRKYKDKVEANLQEGIKAGVDATPGSFVNGKLIVGAVPYSSLKTEIEQAIGN